MESPPHQESSSFTSILSDQQQIAASGIIFVCLIAIVGLSALRQWRRQTLVDIERPFESREVELSICLNDATWPELTLLPEVSETLARRIVEFRQANGPFESLDELKNVQGIGPRTFDLVQPFLQPLDGNLAPNAENLGSLSGVQVQ